MEKLCKKDLLLTCSKLGIKVSSTKKKNEIIEIIEKNQKLNEDINILKTGKNIKYIYHLSDIHIRILDRHQEYRLVFERLYDYLRSQKEINESVIVITGDIFHTRDRLVSETIILFNNFIENLCSITDVVLIAGNHDTFIQNDRLDVISGITTIKTFDNFYFLKEAGVYRHSNIDFVYLGFNTILQNLLEYTTVNTNILLHHGIINGSKLDNGYVVVDKGLSLSQLKNFDIVLLGDIHKRQNLSSNTAYAGSLIQQNFKEELNHGLLKWNVEDRVSTFIDISNDYGFITINPSKDNLENIHFPLHSRVKLVYDYQFVLENTFNENEYIKSLEQYTNIISITKEIEDKCNPNLEENEIQENKGQCIFEKLIETYNDITQEKLIKIHTDYLEEYDTFETSKTCSWRITNLEFSNVFIYGNDCINKITFGENHKIIGILGDNAIGKSSIMNIILYCLFGCITKTKSYINKSIINKNSNNFYIKLYITQGNTNFLIERQGKLRTRGNNKGLEDNLSFYKIDGEDLFNLSESCKSSTLDKIHNILNLIDKDTFILTNVLSYNNYISLLNMTSAELGNTLTKIFNLSKYEDIYKKVFKIHKGFVNKMKEKQSLLKDFEDTLEKINKIKVSKKLKEFTSILEIKQKELEEIQDDLSKLSVSNVSFTNQELKLLESLNKEDLQNNLDNIKVCLHCSEGNSKVLEDKCFYIVDKNIKELELQITLLQSQISTRHCPYSYKDYTNSQKSITDNFGLQDFIEDLNQCGMTNEGYIIPQDLYTDLLYLLEQLPNEMKNIQEYVSIIHSYENYQKELEDNKILNEKIDNIKQDLFVLECMKCIILKDIEDYQKFSGLLEKFVEYEKSKNDVVLRNQLTSQQKQITKDINETNIYIGKLIEKIDTCKDLEIKITLLNSEILELKQEVELYKIYKDIVHCSNLPKIIMNNTIKQIERDTNTIIYKLCELSIILSSETEGENNSKWELILKKGNVLLGTEQISGYERFIVNIGLKLSLDKNKLNGEGSKMFMIDEVFDVISEENFDKVDELFEFLKEYYQTILVVSHNYALKDKVSSRIEIENDGISSKIL